MSNNIKKLNIGYFFIAICGILLITAFSYGIDNLISSIESQKQATEIYNTTQNIMKTCLDSETGLRGFLLTKNETFLEPYTISQSLFVNQITKLKKLTADIPEEKEYVEKIDVLFKEWSILSENKDTTNKNFLNNRLLKRKQIMDDIRKNVSIILAIEQEKVDDLYKNTQYKKTFARWLSLLSSLGIVITCSALSSFLVKKTDELKRTQEKYKIIKNLSGNLEFDGLTNKLYLSPRLKKSLGYEDSELLNTFSAWESLIHPDEKLDFKKAFNDYLEGKTSRFNLKVKIKHKNENYYTFLSDGVALRDDKNKAYYVCCSFINLTEILEKEAVLPEKTEILEDTSNEVKPPKRKRRNRE